MMRTHPHSRGFALLVSIILTSVLLSVGLALLDITYKQIQLASTAKQSEVAFYSADSALECALYWDQQYNSFSYSSPAASVTCSGVSLSLTTSQSGGTRTSTFTTSCIANAQAQVTVYKQSAGGTSIYANGYNTCNTSDLRRVERGIKATY